jgi:UDP-2,4-diacetamido-2,4,6-trideoxy-beta-L-altropyranose hydrolase
MKILFRTDAAIELGTGHVMRCLTLAETLKEKGAECQFVCGVQAGNMVQAIQEKGFKSNGIASTTDWEADAKYTLEVCAGNTFDWIIVDHYGLDVKWEQSLRPKCQKLMVIDDLADRTHDCDLLLDQNLGRLKSDYEPLVPAECQLLIGPNYALLRPEFAAWRDYSLKRRSSNLGLKHLLISMGGTDYPNSTSLILEALKQAPLSSDCRIAVVMGASSPWIQQVRALAKTLPWDTAVNVNVKNMAELMANSDLSIGAAGATTWERCCIGLPSLIVITASNQESGAIAMATSGGATLIGQTQDIGISVPQVLKRIATAFNWQQHVLNCSTICDGSGVNRVLSKMQHLTISVRLVTAADEMLLLEWANDPHTRKNAIDTNPISPLSHKEWFARRLSRPMMCHMVIISLGCTPIGQVRLEENENGVWEIDYSLASSYRGKDLGKAMLNQALIAFGLTGHNDTDVMAKVKSSNVASCKVIESLGFNRIASSTGMNIYKKTINTIKQ